MKNKLIGLGIVCCFIFLSCITLPEADENNQTLVIGTITHQGEGFPTVVNVSLNGTNKKGIIITLREVSSGRIYNMKTNSAGLFYSVNIPAGQYRITNLYLKKERGRASTSIGWAPPANVEHRLTIQNGRVNNLGSISWECISGERNRINYNREYQQARDLFREENSSSNWNEKEWVNINVIGRTL